MRIQHPRTLFLSFSLPRIMVPKAKKTCHGLAQSYLIVYTIIIYTNKPWHLKFICSQSVTCTAITLSCPRQNFKILQWQTYLARSSANSASNLSLHAKNVSTVTGSPCGITTWKEEIEGAEECKAATELQTSNKGTPMLSYVITLNYNERSMGLPGFQGFGIVNNEWMFRLQNSIKTWNLEKDIAIHHPLLLLLLGHPQCCCLDKIVQRAIP